MAKPFFKWAGSKRSLIPQLLPLLPKDADKRRHVEPFLGSGALFFAREAKYAVLSDVNTALISTYEHLQVSSDTILKRLKRLIRTHSENAYYKRRDRFNNLGDDNNLESVVLFLYLNKTCFNGLYRVNAEGAFNVPVGSYKTIIVDTDAIREAHRCLQRHVFFHRYDFYRTSEFVDKNDFVYLDPPYHGENSFRSYTDNGFSDKDQYRLARAFHHMSDYGAKVMLSTSDTPLIRDLYKGCNFTEVSARRSVAASGDKRKKVSELVVRSYK